MLNTKLTNKDKENIDFIEAFELLQMTARPNLKKIRDVEPKKWLQTNIANILDTTEGGEQTENEADTSQDVNNNEPIPCSSLTDMEISTELTVQQFISGIKIWKETASTSPSGRYLGHYNAIMRDENLAQLFTTMTASHLKYGFAPKR